MGSSRKAQVLYSVPVTILSLKGTPCTWGLRTESMISNLLEKLKEIGGESMIMMDSALAKLKEMGADEMMNNLLQKLNELFLMLENFGWFFLGWLDKIFLSETRKEQLQHWWLHVGAPTVVTGLVLLVLFWCCCSTKPVKTMKAPGSNIRMARATFEANPKGYFRNLHASKKN